VTEAIRVVDAVEDLDSSFNNDEIPRWDGSKFNGVAAKLHSLIEDRSVAPNINTSSATFSTAASSASTAFSGRPVLFLLHSTCFGSVAGDTIEVAVQIDSGADNVIAGFFFNEVGIHDNATGFIILTPSAGSHTINLRIRRRAGSGTISFDLNDSILLTAIEL